MKIVWPSVCCMVNTPALHDTHPLASLWGRSTAGPISLPDPTIDCAPLLLAAQPSNRIAGYRTVAVCRVEVCSLEFVTVHANAFHAVPRASEKARPNVLCAVLERTGRKSANRWNFRFVSGGSGGQIPPPAPLHFNHLDEICDSRRAARFGSRHSAKLAAAAKASRIFRNSR
jgi:hypothetical protein